MPSALPRPKGSIRLLVAVLGASFVVRHLVMDSAVRSGQIALPSYLVSTALGLAIFVLISLGVHIVGRRFGMAYWQAVVLSLAGVSVLLVGVTLAPLVLQDALSVPGMIHWPSILWPLAYTAVETAVVGLALWLWERRRNRRLNPAAAFD